MMDYAVLAAFVTPGLLVAGAVATSVPIIIHLIARRRFKRIRWAAIEFLVTAQRRNRRRIRLEEWILLALRCLAVLLIALMLARPFVSPLSLVAGLGGSRPTERIFVIDDSFSMDYRSEVVESRPRAGRRSAAPLGPGETSFERAKLAVRRLVESIRTESPDDTVTVLRTSSIRQPIESGIYLDETQTEELLMRITALTASQQSMDLAGVVEGVVEVLERGPDIGGAVVYVISDFQRHNWIPSDPQASRSEPPATDAHGGIFAPLVQWAGENRGFRLVLVNVGDRNAANTAVTDLALEAGRLVAGSPATLRATIANYARQSKEDVELQVAAGLRHQPSQRIRELPARQRTFVDLEVEFLRTGHSPVRVNLDPDGLPIDNVRYFTAVVAPAIRILVVNGEPSADAYDDEVTFLTTALRPEGELFSGNEVVIVDEAEFDGTNLTEFHLVVLANVYRISDPGVEELEAFVREGGGLVVFLGDQIDADLYNATLYRQGQGLLPARLLETVRAAGAVHLVVADPLHPIMRGFSGAGMPPDAGDRLGLGQVSFSQYFACEPFVGDVPPAAGVLPAAGVPPSAGVLPVAGVPPSAGVLPAAGGGAGRREEPRGLKPTARDGSLDSPDSLAKGELGGLPSLPSARVICRFDDAAENPAIVERSLGLGKVVLVTTSADKEWHQWPDHPTWLPVIMELTRHVARRSDGGPGLAVGSTIELSLDPASFEPDAIVRGPAYPAEREAGVTALPPLPRGGRGGSSADDGRTANTIRGLRLVWEHTDVAGFYKFLLRRREGGTAVRLVAVNVDAAESDLTMALADELRDALAPIPFEYVEGMEELVGGTGSARTEFWRVALFLAAALLMGEQWLAWRWGRR